MIPSIRHLTKSECLLVFPKHPRCRKEEEMSRHNRPASSWGESEQEIQDISFALIALQEIGPTVKRPGLPGASSFVERSVSPCRRRSASVEERKREVVPLEIRDEVQESLPALRKRKCPAGYGRRCWMDFDSIESMF